jgi:UDP-N-acetylmuramate dehydrogenase
MPGLGGVILTQGGGEHLEGGEAIPGEGARAMTGESLRREPQASLPLPVLFPEPLAGYTSMGGGGPADVLAQPVTPEEAGRLLAFLTERAMPYFVAGNWTNLIVRDGGYGGCSLLRRMRTIRVGGSRRGGRITPQAGAILSELVRTVLRRRPGRPGLCRRHPGSLGGAVRK